MQIVPNTRNFERKRNILWLWLLLTGAGWLLVALILAFVVRMASAAAAEPREIHVQSNFPPLLFKETLPGGAHPIGGPAKHFVDLANQALEHLGVRLIFHVPGEIHPVDAGAVGPPITDLSSGFETIHAAVAAGGENGGVDVGIGLGNQNGFPFGELYVAGLPFGMEPDEFAAYLYGGGGLALQQELYNRHFGGKVLVMPVAITATQGGGWFPEPLPDPDTDPALSGEEAMAKLCRKPWIVRWPEPGSKIWATACAVVGTPAEFVGPKTRCADPRKDCPGAGNPESTEVRGLTFGGFVPGIPPHSFLMNGNIDAYELNMPFTEIQMIKLALGQSDRAKADADLRPVVSRAPYYYGQTWHQPLSYVELLINRDFWARLLDSERRLIETAAYRATLENWAISLSRQGEGIDLLKANGAVMLRWPEGLLRVLRAASDAYLDRRADELAAQGETSYRRVLDHMRAYMSRQEVFGDFGDVNQGRARLPTSPGRM